VCVRYDAIATGRRGDDAGHQPHADDEINVAIELTRPGDLQHLPVIDNDRVIGTVARGAW
jgi:hypothetical protein